LGENLAARLDEWDLTIMESHVLQEMYRPGRTCPVSVAQVLDVSKAAASKSISRLVAKRFVRKTLVAGDRRSRGVQLTSLGKMIVPTLAQLEDVTEREFFGTLSDEQRDGLMPMLRRVAHYGRRRPSSMWELPIAKRRRLRGVGAG
jgi:DNA-binding MarR family transcriptional regulator